MTLLTNPVYMLDSLLEPVLFGTPETYTTIADYKAPQHKQILSLPTELKFSGKVNVAESGYKYIMGTVKNEAGDPEDPRPFIVIGSSNYSVELGTVGLLQESAIPPVDTIAIVARGMSNPDGTWSVRIPDGAATNRPLCVIFFDLNDGVSTYSNALVFDGIWPNTAP